MITEIARGLGLKSMYDPAPSAGVPATLSGSNYIDLGSIELVPSMGVARWATFREIYLTNPWVWAAVNIQSRGIGRTPTGVFAIDADGNDDRQRGDTPQTPGRLAAGATLDRLLTNPTPGISRGAVFRGTTRDRMLYGNALWRIDRGPGGGQPVGISRKAWRKVSKVKTDNAGNVLYYEMQRLRGESQPERILPADAVHFGLFEDDEAVAASPLMSCRSTLALHDAVVRHLIGYFKNSMRASGHLSVDRISADKAKEIRDLITEMFTSPENAGKVLVTSGTWTQTSDSPDHAQVIELMRNSREEVAAAYTIPPPVLGILDRAIKSNVEGLRTQYIRDSLGPLGADLCEDIDAQLTTQTAGWQPLHVRFLFEEQLLPDAEGLSLVLQREAPFLTVDEIRTLLGRKALAIDGVTNVPWAVPGSSPMSAWANGNRPAPPRRPGTPPAATNGNGNGHAEDSAEIVLIRTLPSQEAVTHDDDD